MHTHTHKQCKHMHRKANRGEEVVGEETEKRGAGIKSVESDNDSENVRVASRRKTSKK